jgi:hypothetical protein
MEYVYMQQPKPTNTTGVPVTLSVIDSNNNYRQIGSTTTDASGHYSLSWTPDITGAYTVIASFGGSESYWPATTETSFIVNSAASTPMPQTATTAPSMTEQYFLLAVIGIALLIVACFAVTILLLRKRP